MLPAHPAATLATDNTRYSIKIADAAETRAAQLLRHRVFAGELGATLDTPVPGLDVDVYDARCDHLVVVDNPSGAIVGTYRMLPPGRSEVMYSDGEFDLSALTHLRERIVETGRSCVDPAHRGGAVINLMWAGIARYLLLSGHRMLAGCASVPVSVADEVWAYASRRHLSPENLRVVPHRPWPLGMPGPGGVTELARSSNSTVTSGMGTAPPAGHTRGTTPAPRARAAVPPLLRGYLRLGAKVCGPPAFDPEFGVADFFVLLDLDATDPRYLRHYLGEEA